MSRGRRDRAKRRPRCGQSPAAPIALCMIVKDEVQTIARALGSIRPFVAEVNIYDTGSTDGTFELLAELAALPGPPIRVEHGEWRDDFSWAREQSFALASDCCHWLMWLGADDAVVGGAELRRTVAAAPIDVDGFIIAREDGDSWGSRLYVVRRSAAYRWEGFVHEKLARRDGQKGRHEGIAARRVRIHHDSSKANEPGRYIPMIERRIARAFEAGEAPDGDTLGCLGYEYLDAGRLADAVRCLTLAIGDPATKNRLYFTRLLAGSLVRLGDRPAAEAIATQVVAEHPGWLEDAEARDTVFVALGRPDLAETWRRLDAATIAAERRFGPVSSWDDGRRPDPDELMTLLEAAGLVGEFLGDPHARAQTRARSGGTGAADEGLIARVLEAIPTLEAAQEWEQALHLLAHEGAVWGPKARGLVLWALYEFSRGTAQEWLGQRDIAEPDIVVYLVSRIAALFTELYEHHRPLPHYRTMTWAELMEWAATTAAALDSEEAAKWERRDVIFRFENAWTVERIATPHDRVLEGRLMGNCLDEQDAWPTLLSLRDPQGRPHADLAIVAGCVTRVEGRFCRPPKSRYASMIDEFTETTGLPISEGAFSSAAGGLSHAIAAHAEETLAGLDAGA